MHVHGLRGYVQFTYYDVMDCVGMYGCLICPLTCALYVLLRVPYMSSYMHALYVLLYACLICPLICMPFIPTLVSRLICPLICMPYMSSYMHALYVLLYAWLSYLPWLAASSP